MFFVVFSIYQSIKYENVNEFGMTSSPSYLHIRHSNL